MRWSSLFRHSPCLLLLVALGTSPAAAQVSSEGRMAAHLVSASAASDVRTSTGIRQARDLSLSFVRTPLERALRHAAEEADVQLSYSPDVLPRDARVTAQLERATVDEAFAAILEGTGLAARRLPSGIYVIVRAPRASIVREAEERAGVVEGRVVDTTASVAVPGVTVTIVGTRLRATTAVDGRFRIGGVPAGTQRVRAVRVGFEPAEQEVTVVDGGSAAVQLMLRRLPQSLNPMEVRVSTGALVDTEQRRIGNAIEVIGEEQIRATGARDLRGLLGSGQVAGVSGFSNGGEAGAGGTIQIRGATSFLQEQTPLIYIDGIPVEAGSGGLNRRGGIAPERDGNLAEGARLDELTMDQIERIEIIKGPAATTMYGTDAINGVIQIFTKRGAPGRSAITVEAEQGIMTLDGTDGPVASGSARVRLVEDMLFRQAQTRKLSATVSGTSGDANYTLGFSRVGDEGIVIGNENNTTTIRTALSARPRSNFNVSVSGSFVQREYSTRQYTQLLQLADIDNSDNVTDFNFPSLEEALRLGNRTTTETARLYGGIVANYAPVPFWTNQLTLGVDRSSEVNNRVGATSVVNGIERQRVTRDFGRQSARFVSSVAYPAEGAFTSTFSVGLEGYRDDVERFGMRGTNLPDIDVIDLDLAEQVRGGSGLLPTEQSWQVVTLGGFLQEQVGLWDKLFITAGLRIDGNSTFGADYGLQYYPKLSASYVLEPRTWLATKLRAAWGQSGKAPDPFAKDVTYVLQRDNTTGLPLLRLNQPGNPNLKPEVGTELELGVENYFFGNRASLVVNYFRQTTSDALLRLPLPLSTGFTNGPFVNVGELRSQGLELTTSVVPIRTRTRELSFQFAVTRLLENGVVVSLGDAFDYLSTENQGGGMAILQGLQVGESIRDLNFDSPFTRAGFVPGAGVSAGSRTPTTFGGLGANLRLGDLRLITNLKYSMGGHAFDYVQSSRDRRAGLLQSCCFYLPEVAIDRYVYDTDHVRLSNVQVRYQLPQRVVRHFAQRGEIWAEGRNLFLFDNAPHGDPDASTVSGLRGGVTGVVGYILPTPISYLMGLRFNLR